MDLHPKFNFLPKPAQKLDLSEFDELTPPKIPVKVQDVLVRQANQFQKLAPWQSVKENDLFGIRDPNTGALYLISVLGGESDVISLHCHMPPEGMVFWQNAFRGLAVEMDTGLTNIRLLECDFVPEENASEDDLAIYQKHSPKNDIGKLVPCFRSYRPGFYPWFIEAPEAQKLTMVFDLFFRFYSEIVPNKKGFYQWENPFGELPGIPVFYLEGDADPDEVENWSVKMEVLPSEVLAPLKARPEADLKIKSIESLPIREETWEIGSFFMPTPVFNGERPYYPKSAICLRATDSGTRCPLDPIIYGGDSGPKDVEVIRHVFKQLVNHCQYLPEQIRVDSTIALAALEFYGDEFGIEVTDDEQLLMPGLVSEIVSSLDESERRWDDALLEEVVNAIPPEFHEQAADEDLTQSLQALASSVLDDNDTIVSMPDNVIYAEFASSKKASGDDIK